MSEKLISLEGSPEIIKKLAEAATSVGLEHSKPITTESLADPLDAPIGGEEIKHIVQIITLAFQMGTAAAGFFGAMRNVLKEQPGEILAVKDSKTGKEVGTLRADMSEAEMKKVMGV